MTEPNVYITLALTGLVALAMIVTAGLAGWRGWLSLRRLELDQAHDTGLPVAVSTGARIEIADLPTVMAEADVVVATSGRPGLITPDMIRPGQVVLALTNPVPEIEPDAALAAGAAFAADGTRVTDNLDFA